MSTHVQAPAADATLDQGGIREAINRHSKLVGGGAVTLLVLLIIWQAWPESGPQAYYTVDDGKTFFAAKLQAPPIEHGGQQAVRAMVFSSDGGKTKFVGYLMRFTPQGKAAADLALSDPKYRGGPLGGQEVKRPGDAQWVAGGNLGKPVAPVKGAAAGKTYQQVISVTAPGGGPAVVVEPD